MKAKETACLSVPIQDGRWKQILKCGEEPVLTLTLRWPRLPEDRAAVRRVGRYYHQLTQHWRARWEVVLYRRACGTLAAAREHSLPFHPWEAALDYTVTHNEAGLLSLYLDAYEYTGGAHGMTVRCAGTWDLSNGCPRSLGSFFPPRCRWRQTVVNTVREQWAARLAQGETMYLDGWEQAVDSAFDPERFYLAPEGLTVFYPLYTLAPYAEGLPAFVILPVQEAESNRPSGNASPSFV